MHRWFGNACAVQGSVLECVADGDEVCALLPCHSGIVVSDATVDLAQMLCAVERARVVAARAIAPRARAPISEMFMDEIASDAMFSPNSTSPPALRAVLFRRATLEEDDQLLQALLAHGSEAELGFSQVSINAWLEKHGFGDMLLVTAKQLRQQGTSLGNRTLVDAMNVAYIGRHSIWVRCWDEYSRPEIDVMRFNVAALRDPDFWGILRVPSLAVSAVPSVAVVMHTRATKDGVSPYMISTFPRNVFVDEESPELLLVHFLRWLRTCFSSSTRRLHVVSFLGTVYLHPLLQQHWPKQRTGWRLVGSRLVFKHKYVAVLVDAARFACGATLREYCSEWAGRAPRVLADMVPADCVRNAALNADAAMAAAEVLHAAYSAQQTALRGIMPACCADRFPCLGSMALANAAFVGMCSENVRLCFPAHPTAVAFVRESMLYDSVSTLCGSAAESGGDMFLRSVLQHVAAGWYPVGMPYFTRTCNPARLSIALCRVSRKSSVQIPFLFSKECPRAQTFDAVLTSVDISTAVRLGGYKISITSAIEWEASRQVLKPGFHQIITCAHASGCENVCRLVSWLSSSPDVLHSQVLGAGADECLLLAAFAVSYCREKTHAAVAAMDNHFFSAHVAECAYNRVRVCGEFRRVAEEVVTGVASALLTDPL